KSVSSEPGRSAPINNHMPPRGAFMRKLNNKFAIYALSVLVVLSVGVHFLHAFQVKRNLTILKEAANRAKTEHNLEMMVRCLRLYLRESPTDQEALATYGLALADRARGHREYRQAVDGREKGISLDQKQHQLRRRAVDMSLRMEPPMVDNARQHLLKLVEAFPKDMDLRALLAVCYTELKDYKNAAVTLEKLIKDYPKRLA